MTERAEVLILKAKVKNLFRSLQSAQALIWDERKERERMLADFQKILVRIQNRLTELERRAR